MEDAITMSKDLDHKLRQFQYVLREVIVHNKHCFVDPTIYQVETYQIRRRRCYRIMKVSEDQSEVNQLQITLENVSKQLETLTQSGLESWRQWVKKNHKLTEQIDEAVLEWCQKQMKQVLFSLESIENQYPKEEWMDWITKFHH